MPAASLTARLNEAESRHRLLNHGFLEAVRRGVSKDQVAVFLGQWWYPLHYFPTFLGRCVASVARIETKTAISKILYQETGAGNPRVSHETLYVKSMVGAGFEEAQITGAQALPETQALVDVYERASQSALAAIGAIFGTEVVDLTMVSAVGNAVACATGETDLEWVNIHLQQEPDHVEEADHAVMGDFSAEDEDTIVANAEAIWHGWIGFFDRLAAAANLAEVASDVKTP
ncbi:iron-containing redox enzyme family protein [Planctomycetota bacterium]|nr:iron-containing redox enzyme family protein [Planctomycetota bacterium]